MGVIQVVTILTVNVVDRLMLKEKEYVVDCLLGNLEHFALTIGQKCVLLVNCADLKLVRFQIVIQVVTILIVNVMDRLMLKEKEYVVDCLLGNLEHLARTIGQKCVLLVDCADLKLDNSLRRRTT